MNSVRSYVSAMLICLVLTSCDTWIFLGYVAENRSEQEVKILVPYDHVNGLRSTGRADTLMTIKPHEEVMISGIRIMYPSRRAFYRRDPGVCGLKRSIGDTLIELGCSRKEWKYRKGRSTLIFK